MSCDGIVAVLCRHNACRAMSSTNHINPAVAQCAVSVVYSVPKPMSAHHKYAIYDRDGDGGQKPWPWSNRQSSSTYICSAYTNTSAPLGRQPFDPECGNEVPGVAATITMTMTAAAAAAAATGYKDARVPLSRFSRQKIYPTEQRYSYSKRRVHFYAEAGSSSSSSSTSAGLCSAGGLRHVPNVCIAPQSITGLMASVRVHVRVCVVLLHRLCGRPADDRLLLPWRRRQ